MTDLSSSWDAVLVELDRKASRGPAGAGGGVVAVGGSGVCAWRLGGDPVDEFSLALAADERWWFEVKVGAAVFRDTVDRCPFGARTVLQLMDAAVAGGVEIGAEGNLWVRSGELRWVLPAASRWRGERLRRSGRLSSQDRVINPDYPLDPASADIVEALGRQEICLEGERLRIDWLPATEGARLYDGLPG